MYNCSSEIITLLLFSESFSFYEHFDSLLQSGLFNFSWFPWLFTQEYFSWQSSGIERFYPAYLLLLNLINTVRFSQTMAVLQLAAINLILISLIVCQTLSYDVDSFFFIILSGHQTLLYVYDKTNYKCFRLFFLPSSFMQTLYYFIAWLKIRNTISLAIVLFFLFFDLGFTALSRIFHLYRAERSSKVGENRRTRRKTTWPSVSRTWLSHIWPERGSNHSGEKPNGLRVNSLIH